MSVTSNRCSINSKSMEIITFVLSNYSTNGSSGIICGIWRICILDCMGTYKHIYRRLFAFRFVRCKYSTSNGMNGLRLYWPFEYSQCLIAWPWMVQYDLSWWKRDGDIHFLWQLYPNVAISQQDNYHQRIYRSAYCATWWITAENIWMQIWPSGNGFQWYWSSRTHRMDIYHVHIIDLQHWLFGATLLHIADRVEYILMMSPRFGH